MTNLQPCATYDKTTGKWATTAYGQAQNAKVNQLLANDPAALRIVLDRLAVILKQEEKA
jgi:hypothetical protein